MVGARGREEARAAGLLYGAVEEPDATVKPERLRRTEIFNRQSLRVWCGAGLSVLGGLAAGFPLGGLGGAVLIGAVVLMRGRRARFQAAESFEHDYPALLVALASAVRTGLDPLVALTNARELFPPESPVRRELDRVAEEIERGVTEERAIAAFGATSGHPDVPLFRNAFLLARREGSSLGECLHRLAKVTRQRQSFRRKIRSAVAMQKLSALGIAGCAVFIGVFQSVTNPTGLSIALESDIGRAALTGGVVLMVSGLVWMFQLVKARI